MSLSFSDPAFQKALAAWAKHCDAKSLIYQQPDQGFSDKLNGIVYLRNVHGNLARYSVKRGVIY